MDRRTPLAAGLDAASVVLFVAIGKREHDQDSAVAALAETAAPFLIALTLAWLALRVWQHPTAWRTGIGVWAIVMVAGMLLRRFVFDDGTAASFVIVAGAFLGLCLIGWRIVASLTDRRRPPSRATSSSR